MPVIAAVEIKEPEQTLRGRVRNRNSAQTFSVPRGLLITHTFSHFVYRLLRLNNFEINKVKTNSFLALLRM